LEKISGDFAIVSVALQVETAEDRRCLSLGIGLGGVGVAPLKPAGVEAFLLGKKIDDQVIQEASELLENEIDPLSDQRGSAEYKRRVSKVVFRRTLRGVLSGG
jgi:carbon-monoxide dehydrogenase medium subunit